MAVGERLVIYGHWGKVVIIERKPGQALNGEGGKQLREVIVTVLSPRAQTARVYVNGSLTYERPLQKDATLRPETCRRSTIRRK